MSKNEKNSGFIAHVGLGRTRGLMVASAIAMLATASPAAVFGGPDSQTLMDRQRTSIASYCEPSTDGKRNVKRAKKEKLYKNPATRWRT